jgi:hypothetical protein
MSNYKNSLFPNFENFSMAPRIFFAIKYLSPSFDPINSTPVLKSSQPDYVKTDSRSLLREYSFANYNAASTSFDEFTWTH